MALDEALEDEEEIDDNNLLNLNEDDGVFCLLYLSSCHDLIASNVEDVWDEDSAYLEMLAQQSAKLREKSQAEEDGETIASSSEDLEEDLGYFSPLDNVDPYVTFKHALTSKLIINKISRR
jgi:importin-7